MRVVPAILIASAAASLSAADGALIINRESNTTNVAVGPGSSVNSGVSIGGAPQSAANTFLQGNGKPVSRELKPAEFSAVEADDAFDIAVTVGAPPSATVKADENIAPLVSLDSTGGVLRVALSKPVRVSNPISVALSTPKLARVSIGGATVLSAHGLNGGSLAVSLSGAATMQVEGSVKSLTATLSGSNTLEAKNLRCSDAAISITGSGEASLHASASVKASISGAGTVDVYGNPPQIQEHITGAGSINRK